MVDCHPQHGAEVGTYVNLNRMILGFVGEWTPLNWQPGSHLTP